MLQMDEFELTDLYTLRRCAEPPQAVHEVGCQCTVPVFPVPCFPPDHSQLQPHTWPLRHNVTSG